MLHQFFKKGDPFDKTNDRLVSVLPTITKIYDKLIQQQKKYKISFISLLVLVISSYNNQQALVSLIENEKQFYMLKASAVWY